jgi:predicted O-methyltransferase YrrM
MSKIETPLDLLNLAVGYQRSQTLFTFVELEIPKILQNKNLTASDIAPQIKVHPLATERFLNACVAIGLLKKEKDFYSNTEFAEKFLIKENKSYLGGQLRRYQKRSFPQWENLTDSLKKWKYGQMGVDKPEADDQGAEALAEQHNLALMHGEKLAENFDFSACRHLLDVGGGSGAMSIGLCEKIPYLTATVFDLPENIAKAEQFVERAGLKDRIKCVGGDVVKDKLPENFDLALLANLLSVFDSETNKDLFKRIYAQLPEGGKCLISGWILDDDRLAPEVSVLFCLEDICWSSPDVERRSAVYRDWLENAGFKEIEETTYFEPTKLISAEK